MRTFATAGRTSTVGDVGETPARDSSRTGTFEEELQQIQLAVQMNRADFAARQQRVQAASRHAFDDAIAVYALKALYDLFTGSRTKVDPRDDSLVGLDDDVPPREAPKAITPLVSGRTLPASALKT